MNVDSFEREGGGEFVRGKKKEIPQKPIMTSELGTCVLMLICLLVFKQNEIKFIKLWSAITQKPYEIIKQMVMAEQPHQATMLPKSFRSQSLHETGRQEEWQ